MAAHCPRCQSLLPDELGLVLCPSCGHPSFVDASGELRESSGGVSPPPIEPPRKESTDEPAPLDHGSPVFELPQDYSSEMPQDQSGQPQHQIDVDTSPHQPSASSKFSLFQNDEATPQTDPFAKMNQAAAEEINISEYANSEFSQGKNGAFVYNVSISDIDSKEIREFLREAMSDARFNWDAQSLFSQIKNGELLIKNLSPVKATILINRIKRLPVKIRWEQYAITQAEQNI